MAQDGAATVCRLLGRPELFNDFVSVLYQSSLDAISLFKGYYDDQNIFHSFIKNGKLDPDETDAYFKGVHSPMNHAIDINLKYLHQLFTIAEIPSEQQELFINNIDLFTIYDGLMITAQDVHMNQEELAPLLELSLKEIVELLEALLPEEKLHDEKGNKTYDQNMIDEIESRGNRKLLEEHTELNLALLLYAMNAHFVWKSQQVERSILEEKPARLSPRERNHTHLHQQASRGVYGSYERIIDENFIEWSEIFSHSENISEKLKKNTRKA